MTARVSPGTAGTNRPVGPLRAVVSLSPRVVLATAEDAVWRLTWNGPGPPTPPTIRQVAGGLQTPWGLVLDPRYPGRVLVAERDFASPSVPGRLVSVDLTTRALEPLQPMPPVVGEPAFPRPTALAVDSDGVLLAVCQPGASTGRELRGLSLGRTAANQVHSLGPVPADTASLATGPANLRLVAVPGTRDLAAGGGVEQTRALRSFDLATATATVAEAFDPPVRDLQPWRIARGRPFRDPIPGSEQGERGSFVWNSGDVGVRGGILLRATSFDDEEGSPGVTAISRQTGPFADTVSVAVGSLPNSVVAADLDGDGDLDLVCANQFSHDLTVLFQDAPRTFTAQPPLAAGDFPTSVAAADLDGDGDLDLVCTKGGDNDLTVFFQDAPRTFTAQPPLPVGRLPKSVAAADLDGDGDLDLVCANWATDDLTVLLQDAPRAFTAQPPLPVGGGPNDAMAADLDGDGDLDLVSVNQKSDDLTVLLQDAAGTFAALPPIPVGDGPSSVAAADLDGDGDLDLVCANNGSDDLTVLVQGPPETFTTQQPLAAGRGPTCVEAADLDGDGDVDLVSANGALAVLFQGAPRAFTPQPLPTNKWLNSVVAADLDGDSDLDLVAADALSDELAVFFQDAPRAFTALTPIPAGDQPRSIAAADLDGDGDLDLACANNNSDDLTVFIQSAPRTFTALPPIPAGDGPGGIAAADLDGDGDLDLVCANQNSDDLSVFYQDALLTFTAPATLHAGGSPRSTAAADLDGDGDLDLVCANRDSNDLSVFFQDETVKVRAHSHVLGECGAVFMASPRLARLRAGSQPFAVADGTPAGVTSAPEFADAHRSSSARCGLS